MAHEKNVTTTFREKFPNSPFDFAYNRIGTEHESTKHSQHPRHLNPRYMKKFDTIAEAEKEAQSISKSYDKTINQFPVVDILARLIWGEAEGEGAIGMQAVGNVIINRATIKDKNIKDVIMRENQFSSISNPKRLEQIMDLESDNPQYTQALEISQKLIDGELEDITGGATHFYNPKLVDMNIKWIKEYPVIYEHGNHKFARGNF